MKTLLKNVKVLEKIWQEHKDNYKNNVLKFYRYIDELEDLEYLTHLIGFHSAPTVSRIKVGSLVNIKNSKRNLINTWNENKINIAKFFKIKFVELKKDDSSYLIYFYDEDRLLKRIRSEEISLYLSLVGYEKKGSIDSYIKKLKENFEILVPPEVGIFLDYPLLDVIDFMKDSKKCKYCGYWKCYNDVEGAKDRCSIYDITKMEYIAKLIN